MKLILPTAASALALGLVACQAPPARTSLDCPAVRGQLNRVEAAADGKSCLYRTKDGSELTLRLIPVTGSLEATLQPIETALRADVEVAPAVEPSAPPPPPAAGDAAAAKAQAEADAPKAEAKADSSGDHAHVDLPGIHIDAHGDKASVEVGGVTIDADADGAIVKRQHDVRLRGEQLSSQKNGVRSSFLWANSAMKGGFKAVGYEAGGRRSGPLAVATFKVRDHDEDDNIRKSATKLVRKNGGV